MYKALYVSPMIQSSNARETAKFLRDILGFSMVRDEETYIILVKDACSVHIKQVSGHAPDGMEFYLEIDAIDTVWNAIKEKLAGLRVKELFTQPYGMKEVHIHLPYTETIMFLGEWVGEKQ